MDFEQAQDVENILAGHYGIVVEARDDYSGRGMYGDTVAALVLENASDIAYVGWAFRCLGFDFDEIPTRTDSMGLRAILY